MTNLIDHNHLVSQGGIYVLPEQSDTEFVYSDGVPAEEYLRSVLRDAEDLSSTSYELQGKIKDWPSEYHLSNQRANLLRGLDFRHVKRVLELGCGCGAITRYLGEQGIRVDAVEGSRTRAELALLRCQDLENVNIIQANFNKLALPTDSYDAILLIGVAEYAQRFWYGEGTDQEVLIQLLSALKPSLTVDGFLVIAIENRAGLKYAFGAQEDHYGMRYVGIHNYPEPAGIRTYTKTEWIEITKEAGYPSSKYLYPFPDYKLPSVILSDSYIAENPYAYCHLESIDSWGYVFPLTLRFSESLYWEAIHAARSLDRCANSFLILLGDDIRKLHAVGGLDFVHLPGFRRPLATTCLVSKASDQDNVRRIRITESAANIESNGVTHRTGDEPFVRGPLLSVEWARSLLMHDEPSDFEKQLRRYYVFICTYEAQHKARLLIDMIPSNIIVSDRDDPYVVFDQEWEVAWEIEPAFLFFRSLIWFVLRYHPSQALEIIRRHRKITNVRSFVEYGFDVAGNLDKSRIDDFVALETEFQNCVQGDEIEQINLEVPFIGDFNVTPPYATIYWRSDDARYTEADTVVVDMNWDGEKQCLIFDLPRVANSMNRFRFDPCEIGRPEDMGFMYLYRVEVFICEDSGAKTSIWKLSDVHEIAKYGVLKGIVFHHASLGSVFLLTDEDPYVDFPFSPRHKIEHQQHYSIEVELRAPRTPEFLLLRDAYLILQDRLEKSQRKLELLEIDEHKLQELEAIKNSKVWRSARRAKHILNNRILLPGSVLRNAVKLVRHYGLREGTRRGARKAKRALEIALGKPVSARDPLKTQYEIWFEAQSEKPFHCARLTLKQQPLISIVMPVYNLDPIFLQRAIDSVKAQSYTNWELCIADDASTNEKTRHFLEQLDDAKVRLVFLEKNKNISGASNEASKLAAGDYIALMDHDDELAPNALAEVVRIAVETDAQIIYSDEDFIRVDDKLDFPHFKPDYSPDLLLSHNYITHLLVLRKSLFDQLGGFRNGYEGAQDYDLLLRAVECTDKIIHVTKPIYHWRMSKQSTSLNPSVKPDAHNNGKKALRDALSRRGIDGTVEDGNLPHFFRIKRRLVSTPLISIIVPFKDKPDLLHDCLTNVLETTTYPEYEILGVSNDTLTVSTYDVMDHFQKNDQRVRFIEHNVPFNFSCIVNFGVNESHGAHVVLLNNDIEIITPDWLESLLEHSQRPEVAAVGAKLYYPNNTIQHAGIMIGLGGYAGHVHKHFPATSEGYFNRLNVIQNISAVTGALMMVERSVYDELGGFDEECFGIAYNDVDFCLRALGKGYLNVFTPYVEAYHHESISRGYEDTKEKIARFEIEKGNLRQRYQELIKNGDRYYNPNFDQGRDDFAI